MARNAADRLCRAVLFDLDDTLIATSRIDRAAILKAARGRSDVAAKFAALLKAQPFPALAGLSVPVWRASLWACALAPDGEEPSVQKAGDAAQRAHDHWVSERLAHFKFPEPVRALVGRLQAAGYVTGILTNGPSVVQRAKVEACGAAALFGEDRVVLAGELAEQKPAASAFRAACAALGEPPERTIMVGDSYAADIAGGIGSGMLATVWVHPPEAADASLGSVAHDFVAHVPHGQPAPDHTIPSVLELEAVLERIG